MVTKVSINLLKGAKVPSHKKKAPTSLTYAASKGSPPTKWPVVVKKRSLNNVLGKDASLVPTLACDNVMDMVLKETTPAPVMANMTLPEDVMDIDTPLTKNVSTPPSDLPKEVMHAHAPFSAPPKAV